MLPVFKSFPQTGHQTDEEQQRQHEDGKASPRVLEAELLHQLDEDEYPDD